MQPSGGIQYTRLPGGTVEVVSHSYSLAQAEAREWTTGNRIQCWTTENFWDLSPGHSPCEVLLRQNKTKQNQHNQPDKQKNNESLGHQLPCIDTHFYIRPPLLWECKCVRSVNINWISACPLPAVNKPRECGGSGRRPPRASRQVALRDRRCAGRRFYKPLGF